MSSTTSILHAIARWLNYVLAVPMMTFGTLGAVLTIVVFTRRKAFLRNPTIIYLLAGAVMTALHLPSIYSQSILVDGFLLGVFNTNDIACKEHNYLLYVTTVPTISFPCLAAFDQYASTSREASFRHRWRSPRLVRLLIVCTVILWAIVYIPIIVVSRSIDGACMMITSPITKINDFFLTPLVYTVGPLVLIVFFTTRTIHNLRTTFTSSQHSQLTRQIRRMLIPQLVVLAISGVPFGLQSIYFNVTNDTVKDDLRKAVENLFVQIIRLFYHCNFVCPFYIYLYMSAEVRRTLAQLFGMKVASHSRSVVKTLANETVGTRIHN